MFSLNFPMIYLKLHSSDLYTDVEMKSAWSLFLAGKQGELFILVNRHSVNEK